MLKKIFCLIFSTLLVLSIFVPSISAYTPTNFEVDAEGAMLVNLDTGDILYSKNPDKRLYPASLTKMMTALLLYESTNDLDNEIITVSEYAVKSLQGTDSSSGGLKADEQLSARQMLYVLMLYSANEGANAIAEHVSGSIEAFVEKMNLKAAELGMANTHFVNAHGLHDPEHYTTVNDIKKLTLAYLSVGVLKDVCYTSRYTLEATNKNPKRTFTTTNYLMLNNGQKCTAEKYLNEPYYYKYAKGVKTGYTDSAGRCLVSTATKNGYNYLCILMNSPVYNSKNQKIRLEFGDTKALYEWAFNDFCYKTVLNTDEIIGEAPVTLAWDTDFVSVEPGNTLSAIVPKVADESTLKLDINWSKKSYEAPIKKGDVLGEAAVIYAGETLGSVPIIAAHDVERSTLMYIGNAVGNFFESLFDSIWFWIAVMIIIFLIAVFIISLIILNSPRHKRKKRY